jgi:hypothetical protein
MKNAQSPVTYPTTAPRRTPFRKVAAAAAVMAFAATALPMAMAGPAAASTTKYGCTVTPVKPSHAGFTGSARKLVSYAVHFSCNEGRKIQIEQRRYESDQWPNDDDSTGQSFIYHRFPHKEFVKNPMIFKLPDTELGREEVYQKVRFRVSVGDVTSAWTPWKSSRETSFAN